MSDLKDYVIALIQCNTEFDSEDELIEKAVSIEEKVLEVERDKIAAFMRLKSEELEND